jgi:tRNA/tmRNA/rRNA uracil-C5-methylase (TrmA/RlmC/RlmD family)
VRHALPGETVRVVITEDGGGSFCRGDAVGVLVASPHRVTPTCPWAGPGGCGGCDWQHATPAAQRELKAAVVAEQLARLAGIERAVTVEELPGGPLGWRTRMRMAVTDDGRPGLRVHRSHEVLPVGDCPISAPGALLPVLEREWTPTAEVEVVRDAAGEVHAAELFEGARHPEIGSGVAHEEAAGRSWDLPAEAFWQVHPHAADAVVAAVVEGVGDLPPGATAGTSTAAPGSSPRRWPSASAPRVGWCSSRATRRPRRRQGSASRTCRRCRSCGGGSRRRCAVSRARRG